MFRIDVERVRRHRHRRALEVATRDLVHRFYNNQMQINGGRNDRFAAYSDAGALVMGYYDGTRMALWKIARSSRSPTTSSWARSAARS